MEVLWEMLESLNHWQQGMESYITSWNVILVHDSIDQPQRCMSLHSFCKILQYAQCVACMTHDESHANLNHMLISVLNLAIDFIINCILTDSGRPALVFVLFTGLMPGFSNVRYRFFYDIAYYYMACFGRF